VWVHVTHSAFRHASLINAVVGHFGIRSIYCNYSGTMQFHTWNAMLLSGRVVRPWNYWVTCAVNPSHLVAADELLASGECPASLQTVSEECSLSNVQRESDECPKSVSGPPSTPLSPSVFVTDSRRKHANNDNIKLWNYFRVSRLASRFFSPLWISPGARVILSCCHGRAVGIARAEYAVPRDQEI